MNSAPHILSPRRALRRSVGAAALLLLLAFCGAGCSTIDLDQLAQTGEVTVKTRATIGADALDYPVDVYALDASGSVVAHQQLRSADDALALALQQGSYRLTARNDIAMGHADITVADKALTVTIEMAIQVARVHVSLSGVPSDVTGGSVSVGPVYADLALDGALSGETTAEAPLTVAAADAGASGAAGQTWEADFYTLPSAATTTTLSINLSTAVSTSTYSCTYLQQLRAGVPYSLSGTYTDAEALSISGSLVVGGWSDEVAGSFNFGPGADSSSFGTPDDGGSGGTGTGGTPGGGGSGGANGFPPFDGTPYVTSDGHVLALDGMYISAIQYYEVGSALNVDDPDQAAALVAAYSEGGLANWHIPTEEEARLLRDTYSDPLARGTLNDVRMAAGYDAINNTDRYLCEGGLKTFAFRVGTVISTAGSKSTYSLLMVYTGQ